MSNYITFPLDNTDYTANDMALYFSGRTSGVYAETGELDTLSNNNMTVTVTPGRAWITPTKYRGIIFANMENETLTVTMADGILNRIDRVVIKYDVIENKSLMYIKRGNPGSNPTPPTLERDPNTAYELAIAEIYIKAGSTLISPQDITDKRLDDSVCGIVSDGITNVSTTVLENNVNSLLDISRSRCESLMNLTTEELSNLINSSTEELNNFIRNNSRDFSGWFDNIKGLLSGDIATNLANKITEIEANLIEIEEVNLLKQNSTVNELKTSDKTITGAINELFISASNGKSKLATAITGKGIDTSPNDTFETMVANINNLSKVTIDGVTNSITKDVNLVVKDYSSVAASTIKGSFDFEDASILVYNNKIHVIGGFNYRTAHYCWDGTSWAFVSTLPIEFYNGSCVVFNDEIYMLGDPKVYHAFYKWNGTSWTKLTDLPFTFYGECSAFVYNDKIHTMDSDSGIYSWDGTAWTRVSSIPTELKNATSFATLYNNNVYVFMSEIGYVWYGSAWVRLYNNSDYRLANSGIVAYKGDLYHIHYNGYFLKYNFSTNKWVKLPGETLSEYTTATLVYNDKIHYFGGAVDYRRYHYYIEPLYAIN